MAGSVIANLKILLSATWEKLRSDFGKAKKDARSFSAQIKGGFGAAMSALSGVGGAAGAAIGQVTAFGTSLAALGPIALAVAAALGVLMGSAFFTSWGVSLASQTEDAQVALTTMLGSAEHAAAVIQQVKQFAAETPFQKGELIDAAKQLGAFGFQAGDIVPTLRMLGDVSSLIGAPIGEMAELFGKAKVQGRLFMEDINQFAGRGVPIISALAKEMGVSTLAIRKMVSEGQLGFNELFRAFSNLTGLGGQFYKGMIDKSKTLSGLWSTLKDAFAEFAEELGKEFLPILKEAAKLAIDMMNNVLFAVREVKKVLGFKSTDLTDVIENLPREDFSGPTEGLKAAQDSLKDGTKEIKQNAIDIQSLVRDIRGDSGVGRGGIAAVEAGTVAGFSAIQAAKREARFQENLPVELAKRILDKMDQLIAKKQEVTVRRHRS